MVSWDVETLPMKVWSWGLSPPKRLSIDNVIEDKQIIVVCWKELGKGKIHTLTQREMSERELIVRLRQAFDDVDVLVAHYGDRFDLPNFTAKLIEYDLPPLNKIQTVDTWKELNRVAGFSSIKLDYISRKVLDKEKIPTDFLLWRRCAAGEESAFREMEKYCRHDVRLLEEVYVRCRPYFTRHPNLADRGTTNCPFCNSDQFRINKRYRTSLGIEKFHYRCGSCNAPFTVRKIGPVAAETRPYSVV